MFLFSQQSIAQTPIDSLLEVGLNHHHKGNHTVAINIHKQALEIDLNSPIANYELSLTYMYSGDYENAIKYSDIVIEKKKNLIQNAYIVKGSSLSNLNQLKEATKVFNESIILFSHHYLTHYNLSICYSKLQDFEKSEDALI